MRTGIIGTKIGSTSFFNEDGSVVPVTLVKIDDWFIFLKANAVVELTEELFKRSTTLPELSKNSSGLKPC